jgi:hypothetical protein
VPALLRRRLLARKLCGHERADDGGRDARARMPGLVERGHEALALRQASEVRGAGPELQIDDRAGVGPVAPLQERTLVLGRGSGRGRLRGL